MQQRAKQLKVVVGWQIVKTVTSVKTEKFMTTGWASKHLA